jgi:hypothetical protein
MRTLVPYGPVLDIMRFVPARISSPQFCPMGIARAVAVFQPSESLLQVTRPTCAAVRAIL